MIELRTAVKNVLKTIHPHVYYLRAPKDAPFPYLVYNLEAYGEGEGSELIVLDVDGWDEGTDSTPLEILMKNVNSTFDKNVITTENTVVSFYLDRKLPVIDDEPSIMRRTYTYQGRLFNEE